MPFSFPGKYCPVKRKLYRDAHLFYLYVNKENTDLGEGSYENATEAQKAAAEYYRGVEMDATLLPKVKVEVIVSKIPVDKVIEAAKKALYTGHIGDGKIFVYNVMKVVKVRTGEEDYAALQDVE